MSSELQLTMRIERLALKAPVAIKGYRYDDFPVLVAELARSGHVGRGEAAGVIYLGDTVESAQAALAALGPLPVGLDNEALQEMLPPGAARNALDCALWDLRARETGRPVWQLCGLDAPRAVETAFTASADTPDAMAATAMALPGRKLKLKLTGEVALDAARVAAVRAARRDAWIGIDCNQGYEPADFAALLPALLTANVALVEQPLARGCEADMAGLHCPIPTVADESCQSLAELDAMVGRFDMVNIKLDKCGGLTEALAMIVRARALGLGVMVGNMIGTSLAMTPGLLVAQRCNLADLDGAFPLVSDREPELIYADGCLQTPQAGWGSI